MKTLPETTGNPVPPQLKPWGAGNNPDWGNMLRTRNRLIRAAIRELYRDFLGKDGEGKRNGWKAIQRLREEHPDKYILAILGLAPKNLDISATVNHNHLHAAIQDPVAWMKAVIDGYTNVDISPAETIKTFIEAAESEDDEPLPPISPLPDKASPAVKRKHANKAKVREIFGK